MSPDPAPGSDEADLPEIEGYHVRSELGRGGMGVVYRAEQQNPNREVALKIVAPFSLRAASQRLRFLIEIEAMAAVNHPAILPLYESGEDDEGRPWFSMRLSSGGTLAERLDAYRGQWQLTARLVIRLCEAVQFAHERGILHRDLKPGNVIFDEANQAFLTDFGLAKWAEGETDLTLSSEMLGSPSYVAPEVAKGGAKATTTASDVYGLGAVLYELLTGNKIYNGETAAHILSQILHESPTPPRQRVPDIPRDLEIITLKALSREPASRYASAATLAEDLQLWMDGRSIKARPTRAWEHLRNWARRNPLAAALATLLVAGLAAGGIWQWWMNRQLSDSLEDVEARVEFMTRELPALLEPIGRLDLLDSVFQNVSEHYAMSPRKDSESLARQADFLTQWAQILRPQGLEKEAIQRLQQAMEKATAATSENNPSPAAIRARISAGRRLGEALVEGKRFDEGEAALREALEFSQKHPLDGGVTQILEAELATEFAFSARDRAEADRCLELSAVALQKWDPLLPGLLSPPISPTNQRILINVTSLKSMVAMAQREPTAQKAELQRSRQFGETLVRLVPENALFQHHLALIHLQMAALSEDLQERRELLLTAETQLPKLVKNDPGNAKLLTDAVSCAHYLTELSEKQNDQAEFIKWRAKMSERLEQLCEVPSTDPRFLIARAEFSRISAHLHMKDDWPKARRHLEALLKVKRRINELDPAQTDLGHFENRVYERIKEHEGEPAAQAWRQEYDQQNNRNK